MARLLIHVEGETEESFINEVLASHLAHFGYEKVSARLVGNARLRGRRGGIRAWQTVRKDILNHMREDTACIASTMVDFYALPQTGDKGWPGRAAAAALPIDQKGDCVERELLTDIIREMGDGFDSNRFVPFVIVHEFEALLFSDCAAFSKGIGRPDLAVSLQAIRDQFANPEEINDSPITAPSKRVEGLVAGYEKPLLGTLAALEIGLDKIRAQCPHFNDWLTRLEGLPQ